MPYETFPIIMHDVLVSLSIFICWSQGINSDCTEVIENAEAPLFFNSDVENVSVSSVSLLFQLVPCF